MARWGGRRSRRWGGRRPDAARVGTLEERVLLSADFQYITNYNQTLEVGIPTGGFIEYYYGASKGTATVGSSANLKYVPNAGSVGIDHFMAHIRYSNTYANSGYPNYGGYGGNSYTYYDQSVEVNIYLPGPTPYDDSSYTYHNPSSGVDTFTNYFVLKGNTLNVPASGGVLKNDHVGDNSNPLVNLTAFGVTGGYYGNQWKHGGVLAQYGTVSVSGNGAFTYTPFPSAFDLPNFSGLTDTFSYYVKDMAGQESETANVTVELAVLDIKRDGLDVNINTTQANPWVGEKVSLSVGVKGKVALNGAKYQWSVGSVAVKDYTGWSLFEGNDPDLVSTGARVEFEASDFSSSSIAPHWVDGGSKSVSVTVMVVGQTGSDSDTFNVSKPTSHATSVTGSVSVVFAGNTTIVTNQSTDGTPGIVFSRTPDSAAEAVGSFRWTQIVNVDQITRQITEGGEEQYVRNDRGVDIKPEYPHAGDNPRFSFPKKYDKVSRSFRADMYLMHKHNSDGAIWVPVEVIHWGFDWTLSWTHPAVPGDSHHLTMDVAPNPAGVPTTDFPEWTRILGPIYIDDIDDLNWQVTT